MYFDFSLAIVFFLVFICSCFVIGVLLLKYNSKINLKKQILQTELERQKILFPIKIKAIERYALFLERIKIENLLVRIKPVSKDIQQYKLLLNATIEQEFNHNAVQKIYISATCFQSIEKATQDIIGFIDKTSLATTSSISDFNEALLSNCLDYNTSITNTLVILKHEVNQYI